MQSKASPDPFQETGITSPALWVSKWLRFQGCLVLSEPSNGLSWEPHWRWGLSTCTHTFTLRKEVPGFSFLEKHQMLEMHFPLRLGWFVVCRPELFPMQFFCGPGLCQPCCCTSPALLHVSAPYLFRGMRSLLVGQRAPDSTEEPVSASERGS